MHLDFFASWRENSLSEQTKTYMKLCYLNILWTLDPGVLSKLSHQTRALRNALGRDDIADCLVVFCQDIAETVQKKLISHTISNLGPRIFVSAGSAPAVSGLVKTEEST